MKKRRKKKGRGEESLMLLNNSLDLFSLKSLSVKTFSVDKTNKP